MKVKDDLNANDYHDMADLFDQFAGQCEIAFEDHRPKAKAEAKKRLLRMSLRATAIALDYARSQRD